MKIADFVGYISMSGKDRVLDFSPTDRWVGKNPGQWKPFKVPPVAKAQDFMADLFVKGRAALGSMSDESAKIVQLVDDWRAAIGTYKTADECTKAVAEINAIALPIAQAQAKRLLADHAKTLKLEWKADRFILTEKEAVPA